MADRAIQFTISTVDRATDTINKINKNIAAMTRPYENLAKSAARFSKASGLSAVATNLGKITSQATKAAAAITKIGAPLLAIVGGGTIAGMVEMVTQWERLGAQTERTARLMGVTANALTQMRGAATLAGVSAETMTEGFKSFQDVLQDARWGRNQAAFAGLQALGITLKTTKSGAIDTQAALYDLADRISAVQKRDPAAARNLARQFGVESLLPVLIKGRAGMQAYEKEAERLRGTFTADMASRADAFATSLSSLQLAGEGLKTTIADKLEPVLKPMIDRFTEWIAKNRDLIGQRVAVIVQQIADAIARVDWDKFGQGVSDAVTGLFNFVTWIGKVVDAIGGWKNVAIGVALYMAGGFIASIATTIGSIVLLIAKLGQLARSYQAAGSAAKTAGSEMVTAGNEATTATGKMGRGALAGLKGGAAAAGITGAVEIATIALGSGTKQEKERASAGALGGTVGGVTGAAIGGAIGSVVPVVGTAIGATLGGVAGDWIGRKIGSAAGDALFGKAQDEGVLPTPGETAAAAATAPAAAAAGGGAEAAVPPIAAGAAVAGAAPAAGLGVGTRVRQWASQLNFAGLEKQYALPPGLLSALAEQESKGNPLARSGRGAAGLFQFMPDTAKEYGINALDPAQSAGAAARKMSGLLKMFRGNMTLALSAYNWGEGNVMRRGLGAAPAETRAYAPDVLARLASLNGGAAPGAGASAPPVTPLYASAGAPGMGAAAPVVHVHNAVHVARDGSVSIRTQTPSGLKISRPSVGMPEATA